MNYKQDAIKTLEIEAESILQLIPRISDDFVKACQLIEHCRGRVIVMGMGKSGHVARKIAATFASTGTPAFFVHPAEASHGDLGMITTNDIVLLLSNSGETSEIIHILPIIKRQGIAIIAMTGKNPSTISEQANIHLDVSVKREACPLNLAPTASTTVNLALGDALAVAVLEAKHFDANDFAKSHPGGKLGRKLLTYVSDIMTRNDDIPVSRENDNILDTIIKISNYGLGFTIVSEAQKVIGVFTDGDLRRIFVSYQNEKQDLGQLMVKDFMSRNPIVISSHILADEALQIMESKKITSVPVVNENNKLVGAITMHDLLQAGIA